MLTESLMAAAAAAAEEERRRKRSVSASIRHMVAADDAHRLAAKSASCLRFGKI